MDSLEAISPIDGRYRKVTEPLAEIFSERGLISSRVQVEGEYLLALSEHPNINVRTFSTEEKQMIRGLYSLSLEDAAIVKAFEIKGYKNIKATNHDVKAVEYYLKDRLEGTSLEDVTEFIHFGLTSEDTNNLSYALMLQESIGILLPSLNELYDSLTNFSDKYKNLPMLARTHGQAASPTTFGKEFKVFASRLERQLEQLEQQELLVKLNGATGNYNAHVAAYPHVDWLKFTENFIATLNKNKHFLKLTPNFITTQIEPHDSYAELFDNLKRINTILIGLDQDLWRYISDDWITQKQVDGEIGSSTMPHKINPIDFENSEGNLGLANALFTYFSGKLPISRLQRDLSDSTVERNFGVAFAHSLIGYSSTLKGLKKISVNEEKVLQELEKHPEVISEALQTILRREGIDTPYEQLKTLTRGRKMTMVDFEHFINNLDISEKLKKELNTLTPSGYIGLASNLVEL